MNTDQQSAIHIDNQAPRVSIIIPVYLSASFISETLDSVFAQAFSDYEVIIINDGSPDTPQLEVALQPYMARIRYVKQENKGPSGARNAGIRHARGEFLAFLDSDDVWLPEYLGAQVRFLENHPRVDASIADALVYSETAEEISWRMLREGRSNILTFREMLRREGGQIPSASMARRQRVIEVGMFDERLRLAEDLEFFLRICFPDRAVGYLGEILMKYRKRQGSLTSDPGNRKWNAGEIEALRLIGEKLPLSEAQRQVLDEEIVAARAALSLYDAYRHVSGHEFELAVQCLRSANSYYRDPRITISSICLNVFPRLTARLLNSRWRRSSQNRIRKV